MANIHTPAVSASPSGPDASSSSDLSPACQAGLLLSATQVARDVGIESTPTETIIEATGAGRTRAYEMRGRVLDQLSAMQRPPGRPSAPPEPPIEAELRAEICSQMLRYVRSHPGSISAGNLRQHYSDGLRHFVLELRERYVHVPLADFAEAIQIPAATLADWLRTPPARTRTQPSSHWKQR